MANPTQCDLGADQPAAARRRPAVRPAQRHGTPTAPVTVTGHGFGATPGVAHARRHDRADRRQLERHADHVHGAEHARRSGPARSVDHQRATGLTSYNGADRCRCSTPQRGDAGQLGDQPAARRGRARQAVRAPSRRRSRRRGRPRRRGTGWSSSGPNAPDRRATRAVSTPRTSSCTTRCGSRASAPAASTRRRRFVPGSIIDGCRLQPRQRRAARPGSPCSAR